MSVQRESSGAAVAEAPVTTTKTVKVHLRRNGVTEDVVVPRGTSLGEVCRQSDLFTRKELRTNASLKSLSFTHPRHGNLTHETPVTDDINVEVTFS